MNIPFDRPLPTVLLYVYPRGFVDEEAVSGVDIYEFAESFDWEQDGWNGLRDTTDPVADTVESGAEDCDIADESDSSAVQQSPSGDCDEAAAVYLSYCVMNDRPCEIAFCHRRLIPRHVVVVDDERVYSNGNIFECSLDEYLDDVGLDGAYTRTIK